MSRLKKAEIYDGFFPKETDEYKNSNRFDDNYYEIFKNPSQKEINDILNHSWYKSIRGVIDQNGNMYIWDGSFSHFEINNYIQNKIPLDYFRFSYSKPTWFFHLEGLGANINTEECKNILKNNKSKLEMIASFNQNVDIVGLLDNKHIMLDSINEFLNENFKEQEGIKMSRLKKVALMNPEMFKGTLKQLGNKGRIILKGIEDYKFSLEQAARIVANDHNLSQKMISKKKELDKAAGEIYSIVFEIENIDITKEYQEQETFVNNPELKNQNDEEVVPSIPQQSQNVEQVTPSQNNTPQKSPVPTNTKNEENPTNNEESNKEESNKEENNEERI